MYLDQGRLEPRVSTGLPLENLKPRAVDFPQREALVDYPPPPRERNHPRQVLETGSFLRALVLPVVLAVWLLLPCSLKLYLLVLRE